MMNNSSGAGENPEAAHEKTLVELSMDAAYWNRGLTYLDIKKYSKALRIW
jgi:hypothetical protein